MGVAARSKIFNPWGVSTATLKPMDFLFDKIMEEITFNKHNKVSGIYKIEWPNGKFYYGQSVDMALRKRTHISDLKRGDTRCKNQILRRVFDKYGMPKFYCIIKCSRELLNSLEQIIITANYEDKNCCNISKSPYVFNPTQHVRDKMKRSRKGIIFTDEHIENFRKAAIRENFGDRLKTGFGRENPFYGKKHNQASKDAMSISKKEMYSNGKSPLCVPVFDSYTGVYYNSFIDFSEVTGISRYILDKRLMGKGRYI